MMNRLVLTLRYSLVALLVLGLAQTEAAAGGPAVSAENRPAGSFLFRCRLLEIEPAAGERVCAELSICKSEATSHVWPLADEGVIEKVAQSDGVKTLADATLVTPANQPASFHSGGTLSIPDGSADGSETELKMGSLIELAPDRDDVWHFGMQYRDAKPMPAGPTIRTARIVFSVDFREAASHICLLPPRHGGRGMIAVVTREECDATPSPVSR
ncbi:type II and III secretion system protein [Rubinisphaera sp. JC750]|uniref:type II and III secretion system protein n=1 Tax=Rubinisphaera sp. JC750 TaxID=2898658 RepID=UPI001F36E6B2|nr:type II and III secretion system protein [Rubinisphaera sp. JC750]